MTRLTQWGFGEASPPRDLCLLVFVSGFARHEYQQRIFLEGRWPSNPHEHATA
jgi:hypothetical protein